jgi:nicotinamide phosphoribosyltransferase
MENLALMTDSYKASHFLQFPPETKRTFYYMSARVKDDFTRFYGLQMFIKKFLMNVPTMEQIDEAAKWWPKHGLPFNYEGWKKIVDLGYLPLKIKGIPEGMVVPGDVPLVTVTNTTDDSYWLPGWIETLLMQLWYPTTVCTNSYKIKQEILKWLEMSGTPEDIMFKLHDFGYRGATSQESAEIGGSAHLVNFMGTDTVAGVHAAQRYYNTEDMIAFSIPAAEHSTMTSWGRDNEKDAYENMIDKFAKPGSLVAVVSDSYDLYYAVRNIWGGELKQKVLDSGATIVIRPDSGDPADVVLKTLDILDETFGTTKNDKGYKVLNSAVRIIQGDGMSGVEDVRRVLETITDMGYSADNLAFGMGGGLIQKCDRDTYKFAMKCSAVYDGDVWYDVFKNPVDAPWKASKKGRLDVSPDMKTVNTDTYDGPTIMRTVFENGVLRVDDTFEAVRNR